MRRDYRRGREDGIDTKKVLYITGTVLALAVIAFVITFFVIIDVVAACITIGAITTPIIDIIKNDIANFIINFFILIPPKSLFKFKRS